jgi:hypothetical protein
MEQLSWLPVHADLSAEISSAKRMADPVDRLAMAMRLAGYRRDFTATGRLDKLAAEGLADSTVEPRLPEPHSAWPSLPPTR